MKSFSGPPQTLTLNGILFDFDGTIVDSTKAIEKHWHNLGKILNIDGDEIIKMSHGRRSIDVLKLYAPDKANQKDVSAWESAIPRTLGAHATEIPGARALLHTLESNGARWAVVTSGTHALVTGWLEVLQLAKPAHMVVAEDVKVGKPDPTCYQLGWAQLGLSGGGKGDDDGNNSETNGAVAPPARTSGSPTPAADSGPGPSPITKPGLVVEDAPSGIRAGKAAGFHVLALMTTHPAAALEEAGADWVVRDLRSVEVVGVGEDGKTTVVIRDVLSPQESSSVAAAGQ